MAAKDLIQKVPGIADDGIPTYMADEQIDSLAVRLRGLQRDLAAAWAKSELKLPIVEKKNRSSARNLIHYLALRGMDIRGVQLALAKQGISSLGRAESHVMWNITKVVKLLYRLTGKEYHAIDAAEDSLDIDAGIVILRERAIELLGSERSGRKVRIMVTLPSEAADDYTLVRDLVSVGMDCARINCAHDGPQAWQRMVDNIKQAEQESGRECRICMDIAGPKLRTGPYEPGPRIVKLTPKREIFGPVVAPVNVRITSGDDAPTASYPDAFQLHVPDKITNILKPGVEITFKDNRGSQRTIIVKEVGAGAARAELFNAAYLVPETEFHVVDPRNGERISFTASDVPPVEQFARLKKGERALITARGPGRSEVRMDDGTMLEPARISCTLPAIFEFVRPGEAVWFNDGKIGGVIESTNLDEMQVLITQAGPNGNKLRADKSINLPDTDLRLPPLTEKDLEDLEFIVGHADMVGHSFVRSGSDVRALQTELKRLGGQGLGVVLKIETRSAFENLPEILLTALESREIGVMIARGDLAVECGFERLAEIQEEILWMCEAAHVPVIWATQVLEQLSKKGVYSRAEITDAAMSERAECVMLNKGPFTVEAVATLDDILARMASHQYKKRSLLRPLHVARRYMEKLEKT